MNYGESREAIAFSLLMQVASGEGKRSDTGIRAEKKWILDTYKECLAIVKGEQPSPTIALGGPTTR